MPLSNWRCPQCGAWTEVVDSRLPQRRRRCGNEHRFSTVEVEASEWRTAQQLKDERLKHARMLLRRLGYLK